MTDARMNRRLAAMLSIRLGEARLDEVRDDRDPRGVRWPLDTLLRAVVVGMAVGAESLAKVEKFTESLSRAMRRKLGISRRLPDTTLRDNLCTVDPEQLGPCVRALTRAAHRRKALAPVGLPFGVASLDGKGTALPTADDHYAQRQTHGEDGSLVGIVRTVTASLTSSQARPCIDVTSIPAKTNEMGILQAALEHLVTAYAGLDLFRVITYDAGACSLENATAVRAHHLHYVLGLTAAQPTLFEAARLWLGVRTPEQADAVSVDHVSGTTVTRRLYVGAAREVDSPARRGSPRNVKRSRGTPRTPCGRHSSRPPLPGLSASDQGCSGRRCTVQPRMRSAGCSPKPMRTNGSWADGAASSRPR